jgi:hypothetical protein
MSPSRVNLNNLSSIDLAVLPHSHHVGDNQDGFGATALSDFECVLPPDTADIPLL